MTTAGELLAAARHKRNLTLEQAEKATKIRAKFLLAMEENDFAVLPSGPFARGLMKNYARFLHLPEEEILAFYRRQVNTEKEKPARLWSAENLANSPWRFSWPVLGAAALFCLFVGYLVFAYWRFAAGPALVIHRPANNSVVAEEQAEIIGKTDPEATIAINNQPVRVEENGSFAATVRLQPGLNKITVTAKNRFQRETTVTRDLRLEKEIAP
jgi:cytoskeletal protein RodZ